MLQDAFVHLGGYTHGTSVQSDHRPISLNFFRSTASMSQTSITFALLALLDFAFLIVPPASAQTLKSLSVEDLMNLEVTSVSKRPERLFETASAIQVITREDIRR